MHQSHIVPERNGLGRPRLVNSLHTILERVFVTVGVEEEVRLRSVRGSTVERASDGFPDRYLSFLAEHDVSFANR